ncbi:MAG: sigma-70 family RNA polymerase sigma factor [Sphingomonas sp.]|nr:sigma-70 family RNA polymerase sigma factor [Sphingomonas sp.]
MRRRGPSGMELVQVPPRVEAALWRRFRFEAEQACRATIFDRYRPLARQLARRQLRTRPSTGLEVADLEQFAYAGLLQAIDRFDPLRGTPFRSYAQPRIIGSIADGAARMSERDAHYGYRRRVASERARSLGMSGESAVDALTELATSLAIGLMLEDTGLIEREDGACHRPSAYDSLAWRELQALLEREIEQLGEREAFIVRQHYLHGVSFAQIAELLDLSRGRVSQLHAAALKSLARRLGGLH